MERKWRDYGGSRSHDWPSVEWRNNGGCLAARKYWINVHASRAAQNGLQLDVLHSGFQGTNKFTEVRLYRSSLQEAQEGGVPDTLQYPTGPIAASAFLRFGTILAQQWALSVVGAHCLTEK